MEDNAEKKRVTAIIFRNPDAIGMPIFTIGLALDGIVFCDQFISNHFLTETAVRRAASNLQEQIDKGLFDKQIAAQTGYISHSLAALRAQWAEHEARLV